MALTGPGTPERPAATDATRDVLVLRALGLGDLLTAVPALRGLRRAHPQARITLATPGPLAPLALLTGAVDAIAPTAGLGELRRPHRAPDLAVNLHGRGPQSTAELAATAPRRLVAHAHPAFPGVVGPAWPDDVHEVDRWCALLAAAGVGCDPADLRLERPDVALPDVAEAGGRTDGLVVVHPGAAAPSRRWPPERFAAVAAGLAADGHRVVVTGSAVERGLAEGVAEGAGLRAEAILAGTLGVSGLVALIADAALLVCGDTGVAHVATATATASVVLFGPTPPAWWGPRGDGRHTVVWTGGRGDPHGRHLDPGLAAIGADRVLAESRALLAGPATWAASKS